jgi:anaphase-promoting complex subunit 3
MQLGKLTEAESALIPDNDVARVPNGAAGHYLLGRIYQLSNRHSVAITHYATAVQLDPMMWAAYEELCALGADQEAQQYVGAAAGGAGPAAAPASGARPPGGVGPSGVDVGGFTFATHTPPAGQTAAFGGGGAAPMSGVRTAATATAPWPSAGTSHAGTPSPGGYLTPGMAAGPSGPPPAPRGGNGAWPPPGSAPQGGSPMLLSGAGGMADQRKFLDEGKMRKVSNKLFVEPASILRRMQAAGALASAASPADEGDALAATAAVAGVPRGERSQEGQAGAVALLQALGEALRLLSAYRCAEAVDAFGRLPPRHFQTGWVLTQVGRAYFEMVDYQSAARAFQSSRQVDPFRLRGLEVYSTVLWHMKREVELSYLAQEAVALDRHSPAAWCVMGNCFSLQKEHETALRYFQRALQLDAAQPYAYTLAGHELFANEDFEKAVACYRNAIRVDPRHYNAWFGMGHVYYRQEKFGMAEFHFRRALSINPRSSVLRCYLGMALHALTRNGEALAELGAAIAADPRNPLARFEKAAVLLAEARLPEALAELTALRDVAPREASVLFHMGKIYKRMGRTADALACLSAALDLQPPSADTNLIKSAIERVATSDAEEEEEI